MRVLSAVLICLVIFAIFSYTAATLETLIQQDNLVSKEKIALYSSLKARTPKEKPGLITLGDPINDPKPHQ